MPAFRCCHQEWNLADDDFVPSALLSTATRFCLFCWILCANAYILVTLGRTTVDCPGVDCCDSQPYWVLTLYLFGELLLEFCEMVVNFLIFIVSASGNLRVNEKRSQKIRVLLYIRLFSYPLELCFSALGLAVAFHPQLLKQSGCVSSHMFPLLASYSIVTVVVSILKIVFYLIVMDPAGCCTPGSIGYVSEMKYNVENTESVEAKRARGLTRQTQSTASITIDDGFRRIIGGHRSKTRRDTQHTLYNRGTTQLWQNRINKVACGGFTGPRQLLQSSVHDVAKIFSIFFENTNYTVSDLTTAIVLVRNEQVELWKRGHLLQRSVRKKLIEQMREAEFCDGKAQYKYQPPVPVNLSNPDEFTEVEDTVYFFRYAMAVYGWPLYVFGNPKTGCCKLCCKSAGICCILGKCCRCNDAAFKLVAEMGITEENIVHCSEKNELFCSPFAVVLDHQKKSLVVTIRGTLSMEDAITSMSISLTPLYLSELPYSNLDTQVHKGWHVTAVNILNELIRLKVFKLFKDYPDYRLIIVGHSLGGAVATILSLLIYSQHKEFATRLKCYGYSTPGCVFSYPLAKYCHDFVTTVVVDNDLLPHLNWRSLLLLRAALKEKLETCDKPKHQVLCVDPLLAGCTMSSGKQEEDGVKRRLTKKQVDDLVNTVYDNPDWQSLGHFSGHHIVTLEAAISAKVFAGKWKKKALGVIPQRPSQQILESHEVEARKFNSAPAFLPGKVLQIDTSQERLCPGLPWPKTTHCQMKWVANEDYCLVYLHRGPLKSHLPDHVGCVLSKVKKQYLQAESLERVFTEISPNFTFGRSKNLTFDEEDEDAYYEQESAAAAATDLDELHPGKIEVDVAENIV